MTRGTSLSILIAGLWLCGCGDTATSPESTTVSNDGGCSAADFGAASADARNISRLLRDCGVRTATEAEELLASYPTRSTFHRPAGAAEPLRIVAQTGPQDLLVCNLSANRGVFDAPSSTPPRRVITGRSCWEFEGVDQVTLLGGRSPADPSGDGDGPAAEEWFGVYFLKPKS
jgi:hypothetical protein